MLEISSASLISHVDKIETAGRRVEKFVEVMTSAYDMENSYENRVLALIEAIRKQMKDWENASFVGTYIDAKLQSTTFLTYKAGTKRKWIAEKTDIASMLGNIRTKLATYGLKEYEPSKSLNLSDLDDCWRTLLVAEAIRSKNINEAIREYAYLSSMLFLI